MHSLIRLREPNSYSPSSALPIHWRSQAAETGCATGGAAAVFCYARYPFRRELRSIDTQGSVIVCRAKGRSVSEAHHEVSSLQNWANHD